MRLYTEEEGHYPPPPPPKKDKISNFPPSSVSYFLSLTFRNRNWSSNFDLLYLGIFYIVHNLQIPYFTGHRSQCTQSAPGE